MCTFVKVMASRLSAQLVEIADVVELTTAGRLEDVCIRRIIFARGRES